MEIWLRKLTGSIGSAYRIIACAVTVLGISSAVAIRDSPESVGLLPDLSKYAPVQAGESANVPNDGTSIKNKEAQPTVPDSDLSMTRAQALRTILFWAIVLCQFNNSVLWVGCHFNLTDLFESKGLQPDTTSQFYMTVALTRLVVSLAIGSCIVDRLNQRTYLLLAVQCIPQTSAVLMLLGHLGPTSWGSWMPSIFGCVYGTWGGIFNVVGNVVFAQIFGRAHLGAISGLAKGISLCAGALGPEFIGLAREQTGSYSAALHILAISTIVSAALLLLAPLPRPVHSTSQLHKDHERSGANPNSKVATTEDGCTAVVAPLPIGKELGGDGSH